MLKLQSICRLGQDAVVNNVNGKTVINFSAAVSDKFKNLEGIEVNNTTWISCAYWNERTAVASYLKKGVQIYIEGKPEVKIYNNKQGQAVPQLYVRVSSIKLLSSNDREEQSDDLPF